MLATNEENLRPVRSKEEARERGRAGGIASGEARRNKKKMRETLEVLLDMTMKNGKSVDIDKIKSFASLKGKNLNVQQAVIISLLQKALRGDIKAIELIFEISNQSEIGKPTDELIDDGLSKSLKELAEELNDD